MMKQNRNNSTSNRRITSEKYYDCFQCAEQCRHLSFKNNYNYTNNSNKNSYMNANKNTYNSNRNAYKNSCNGNKNSYNTNNKNYHNDNKMYNSNKNHQTIIYNSNKNSYNSNKNGFNSTKNSYNNCNKIYNANKKTKNSHKNKNIKSAKNNTNDTKKINDIINESKSYFSSKKNEKKNEKICLVKEKVMKTIKNQEISSSKHFEINNKLSSNIIDYKSAKNEIMNNISSYQYRHATKRSSLARPVRVYDSFTPPKWMMMGNDSVCPLEEFQDIDDQEGFADQQQQLGNEFDNDGDDVDNERDNDNLDQPNSNRAFIDAQDEDANWPIRLRLEELLEQNKKKKRKGIVTIRKSKIINADPGKNSFKDTERLLKVLSNHVDQDSRYNVKRCCVM